MEQSEFDDWVDATKAVEIDDTIRMMNGSTPSQKVADQLGIKQRILLGMNPWLEPDRGHVDFDKWVSSLDKEAIKSH